MYELKPDIIGVTESWAGPMVSDSELSLSGYDLFRQDRPVDRNGGGVLLYVRSSLQAVQCKMSSEYPEHVWCHIIDCW